MRAVFSRFPGRFARNVVPSRETNPGVPFEALQVSGAGDLPGSVARGALGVHGLRDERRRGDQQQEDPARRAALHDQASVDPQGTDRAIPSANA